MKWLALALFAIPLSADVPTAEDIAVLQQQFEVLKAQRDEALDQRDKLLQRILDLQAATNCA